MENQYNKLHNLKENTDSVFNEIFGFGKKSGKDAVRKSAESSTGEGNVVRIGENEFKMGNSVVTRLRGVSEEVFLDYDFENSPLKWLVDSEFKGQLTLKLTGQVEVTGFVGEWFDGKFKGKFFGAQSTFRGGQFGDTDAKPVFSPEYDAWKVSPYYFFDGIIKNTNGGILGIKNLDPGIIDYSFNILAIKPGQKITINLNGGIKHEITCISRLGGSNRSFVYDIVNGKTGKNYKVSYDWSDIRGTDKVSFHKNTTINFQSPSLESINAFRLDVSEGIESATVSIAGTSGPISQPKIQDIDFARTQQEYDLAKIPGLNVKQQKRGPAGKMLPLPPAAKGKAYFYIPDSSYMNKFKEVTSNIESGVFQKDVSIVGDALRNNVIDGAGRGNKYLASIIGESDNKNAPEDIKASLNRLDDFVRFFINRMYIQGDNNKIDQERQELVKDRLKSALGISKPEGEGEKEPVKPKKVKKVKMKEFRELINNIISENL